MNDIAKTRQVCLAIEATNRWLVAGLVSDEREFPPDCSLATEAPRESFRRLIPDIGGLLQRGGIARPDWLAATRGPGSFTGTRISVGAARNLAQLWDIPVRSLPSTALYLHSCALAARKAGAAPAQEIAIMIDGKQERVFAAHSTIDAALSGAIVTDSTTDAQDLPPDAFLARLFERSPDALVYVDDRESVRKYIREPSVSGLRADADRLKIQDWRPMQAPTAGQLRDLCLAPGVRESGWRELVPDYLREDPATSKFQNKNQVSEPPK